MPRRRPARRAAPDDHPWSGRRLLAVAVLTLCSLPLLAGSAAAQQDGAVHVTEVHGVITPVVADHITDAIEQAAQADAPLLVLQMDTPGGLDTSMRAIVQAILGSPVPVAVHVTPPGARAASAGSVIALSAHVAAMAPGTNIGAATPIDLQAGEVADKVVNDAAAYVEALAELRGRDAQFYIDTVVEGASASASDALEAGAIDLIAEDLDELLAALEGTEVEVSGRGAVRITTQDVDVVTVELSWVRQLLQRLANPDLAFLFISLGTLAIVYEIANPGGGIGGAVGGILLILAFFSLSVLPFNVAGLLLVALAAGLFIAEAFVPGVGAFAGGGALALLAAGLLLFQRPTGVGVSLGLALGMAAVTGALALLIASVAVQVRNAPPTIGAAGTVVGAIGVVKDADGMTGQVLVEGARWQAQSTEPLTVGMQVRVVGLDGLTVTVQPEVQPVS
ncbi:MAG TPA: nodulation protein NfeD [Euzebya sp.]|nr:nodulation protein NfeD [Euzebya sp.]